MSIFNMMGRYGENVVTEDNSYQEGNEDVLELLNDPREIKKLTLWIVKSIIETGNRSLLDGDDKDIELRKKLVRKAALNIIKQKGLANHSEFKVKIIEELDKYLWGYYVLDDLINDPDVSDIRVLNWNYIRYKKLGQRMKYDGSFIDLNDYMQYINMLAVRNKKSLSDVNAITYFTDNSNNKFILRFNICTQFVSSNKIPILTIRKIPKEKYTLEGLIKCGMMDLKCAMYLKDKAANASGILFTGKGASGKTTLLNTLLEYIDENQSAIVIQESDELFISDCFDEEGNEVPSKDIAFLHTVSYNGEGKIEYSLAELTRNGLRMDLDYYIIGEIKGDEAVGFSMASFTGHKCWATVHGMNSFEGINKLADYIKQATGYGFNDCLKKLIGIQVIVFMKEFKVEEITEVYGYDDKVCDLIKNVIYKEGRWLC